MLTTYCSNACEINSLTLNEFTVNHELQLLVIFTFKFLNKWHSIAKRHSSLSTTLPWRYFRFWAFNELCNFYACIKFTISFPVCINRLTLDGFRGKNKLAL